ncbi:MAG: ABC transporter permease [Holosporales bacterium]|jgi:ribose transport system permease protein|nr:ABC transporter permease [Holosporales bacterium]
MNNQINDVKKSLFFKIRRSRLISEGSLLIVLIVMIVFLSIMSDVFLTVKNIQNLLRQASINGIVAIGITFVIIAGGIDLSVGAIVGFSGMLCSIFMRDGMNMFLAIFIALIGSAILGAINGITIHKGKVPPFIATLGMMTVTRGVIMLMSGAAMVSGLPRSFTAFAVAISFGLPAIIWVWIIAIIFAVFITKYTTFGRNIYSIGSNIESSWLSGVNTGKVIVGVYTLCAIFSGVAGIILSSRISSGVPTAGQGYELDAIAAAVIGGASLSGAEGSVFGTVIGAIIMQMLRNGGNLLGVNPFILDIIIGSLIVLTVLFDQRNKLIKE